MPEPRGERAHGRRSGRLSVRRSSEASCPVTGVRWRGTKRVPSVDNDHRTSCLRGTRMVHQASILMADPLRMPASSSSPKRGSERRPGAGLGDFAARSPLSRCESSLFHLRRRPNRRLQQRLQSFADKPSSFESEISASFEQSLDEVSRPVCGLVALRRRLEAIEGALIPRNELVQAGS